MPGPSTYDEEIRNAIAAAGANQGAYNRYAPYPGDTPADAELMRRAPGSNVPLDVAAIVQGILNSQGRK